MTADTWDCYRCNTRYRATKPDVVRLIDGTADVCVMCRHALDDCLANKPVKPGLNLTASPKQKPITAKVSGGNPEHHSFESISARFDALESFVKGRDIWPKDIDARLARLERKTARGQSPYCLSARLDQLERHCFPDEVPPKPEPCEDTQKTCEQCGSKCVNLHSVELTIKYPAGNLKKGFSVCPHCWAKAETVLRGES